MGLRDVPEASERMQQEGMEMPEHEWRRILVNVSSPSSSPITKFVSHTSNSDVTVHRCEVKKVVQTLTPLSSHMHAHLA